MHTLQRWASADRVPLNLTHHPSRLTLTPLPPPLALPLLSDLLRGFQHPLVAEVYYPSFGMTSLTYAGQFWTSEDVQLQARSFEFSLHGARSCSTIVATRRP
jgi:hypothetical protein